MHISYSERWKETVEHIGCPIRSILNELQSFTTRNGDIALKTTKAGVLTRLFAILIRFERISIITVLKRVSWKLYNSRSYKCTFRIQNDERRRFNTSVVQFDQYWTSYNHSQLEMEILHLKRRKEAFNASFRNTYRIWTNFNHSRIKTHIVKTLHLVFV